MDAPSWSVQLLGEFIASVSAAGTQAAAARTAVEHAAETLGAKVAAIVRGGEVVAAIGYPEGAAPIAELEGVRPGAADCWLEVPGAGSCAAAAAALEYPPGTTLVVGRPGPGGLTREETGLLRGMAQVAAMTMRMLSVLDDERSAREELERLAFEQAALRRVATLVAKAASPEEVFAAVAAEVGNVLPAADIALVGHYGDGRVIEFVGGWSRMGEADWVGRRVSLGGQNVATLVSESNEPARVEHLTDDATAATAVARGTGARSSAGAPISVEGRLWGVITVGSVRENGLPAGIEQRLAEFTELVATAIANAQARVELRALADEQAALRRAATLVARGTSSEEVFAAVAAEVGRLLTADLTAVARYDPGGVVTVLGAWSSTGTAMPFSFGTQTSLGGQNMATLVFRTGQPARIDDYGDATGAAADVGRDWGFRAAVGVPISVEGRLWGLMSVASTGEELPPADTEERLVGFTELAGTAIANAQARLELRGYAEEQAALRRVATLVARAAPPEEVFAAVTVEIGQVLSADFTGMSRYEAGGMATAVGVWTRTDTPSTVAVGDRLSLGGRNATTLVFQTGRPARIDDYGDSSGVFADAARGWGFRSAVGVPITVEGRLWGVVSVGYARMESPPADTEARLAGFTELVATAIANAQARVELRGYAEEQAALRRVATLVARAMPPDELFAAVTEEVRRVLNAESTAMFRYDPDRTTTLVGASDTRANLLAPVGTRWSIAGRSLTTLVFETGRPARIDDYADTSGPLADIARERGLRSAVGVPISVEGRLWGVMTVSSTHEQPPPDTEARLARFTELVATAIANAEAQAQLTTSRARIVATADETRRRIEHDLHDGAQQRLVTLALRLRMAQAAVPAGLGELPAELGRVSAGLTSMLDELREYARGIHPAILTERGLVPALKVLARRSPVPVTLDARAKARLPERIEVTAYYVVSEALTNVARHARASAVRVTLDAADEVVQLSVRDDGVGGADPAGGSGLVGLKDRVEAIGGTLIVQSRRGEGTRLVAELPVGAGPPPDPG